MPAPFPGPRAVSLPVANLSPEPWPNVSVPSIGERRGETRLHEPNPRGCVGQEEGQEAAQSTAAPRGPSQGGGDGADREGRLGHRKRRWGHQAKLAALSLTAPSQQRLLRGRWEPAEGTRSPRGANSPKLVADVGSLVANTVKLVANTAKSVANTVKSAAQQPGAVSGVGARRPPTPQPPAPGDPGPASVSPCIGGCLAAKTPSNCRDPRPLSAAGWEPPNIPLSPWGPH